MTTTCAPCLTTAGCNKHKLFTCATCGRLTHWNDGAADDRPNDCSDCWNKWFDSIHAILADLTPQHLDVLTRIARGDNPKIFPMMRWKLVIDLHLLVPAEPPRAARLTPGRQRAPAPRRHELTELGRQVLEAHVAAQEGAAA